MPAPVIYGPHYSTYVRTVRLLCEEKSAEHRLVDVDIFKGEHKAPEHLRRHPFGKVPAFEHDGLALYETSAITRYLDAVLPGPSLTPPSAAGAALMQQAIAVLDSYGYPAMISTIVIQRMIVPMSGGSPDEAAIQAAVPMAETVLRELERMLGQGPWFGGEGLSLADLHLMPIMAYFCATPEGQRLIDATPNLKRWWAAASSRPSMAKTQPQL